MKIIEIITRSAYLDVIKEISQQPGVQDFWWEIKGERHDRLVMRLLVGPQERQAVLDAAQRILLFDVHAHIILIPIEVILACPENAHQPVVLPLTREELYHDIAKGARLNKNFILFVLLSTVVAAIGLLTDNVAVVIGGMVIAPLLGPNVALGLAAALGDIRLFWTALKSNLLGMGLAILLALLIGWFWPLNIDSQELMSRTDVGLDGVVLALASGTAAVLSLTSGLSTALVGVMVAVALLPPATTIGLMLGSQQLSLALGASLLLAVNIVCVNLTANLTFFLQGIKPRTWLEKQKARQAVFTQAIIWLLSLTFLIVVIYWRQAALWST
ncbi:MAG: TIGR00341 family protein [Pseudomonadota bacterium]|nr:TIGR00341 family protein [Pseudomonadota bacterium]